MTERRYDPNNPTKRVRDPAPSRVVLPGPDTAISTDPPSALPPSALPPAAVAVSKGVEWHNPREPVPEQVRDRRTLVERAMAEVPDQSGRLMAAVIIAQALDRLGEKVVEACAVLQYKR
jgi:hypothetical protein